MKFNDFEIITRSRSAPAAVSSRSTSNAIDCPASERDAGAKARPAVGGLALFVAWRKLARAAATRPADL